MKAIRIHTHGGVDELTIDDLPEPVPGHQQVKIKIKASSLNHMDLWVRKGMPGIGAL
ncbi:MAG: alcohol dehydrogenase, partial [Deltaproteobacteria bacterium]|nr:alcohol dehydrogenase [Deltaproteobacteria bacterium]